ncbi:hypothetical protein ACH47Z_24105 [Streptomyces sp. NPDC020192]|uniref:hypothetical protein n=1 Tax=Streptomyces sp. NPDC020192 TaxID=3365066 RepID=UPI0037897D7E
MSMIVLGECRANSSGSALRWLHDRAARLTRRSVAGLGQPVRAWLRDAGELERALALVAAGKSYVSTAVDTWGMRYAFTAEPVGGAVEPLVYRWEGAEWRRRT